MSSGSRPVAVWLIGAGGTLATTTIVGARAIARGLAPRTGLVSDDPRYSVLQLAAIEDLRFGGHEIRPVSMRDAAAAICQENGSIRREWIDAMGDEFAAIDARVRRGVARGGGGAIEAMADSGHVVEAATAAAVVEQLAADMREFAADSRALVVVNVASTEPPPSTEPPASAAELEAALAARPPRDFRPGLLYAWAAVKAGAAYVNFTASPSCIVPALEEFAQARGVPVMGNDGKTGETLVKSGLAPLFRARRLEVASWVGYNILGNRDGSVLAEDANKRSKIASKDSVVASILGRPVQTHVGIDYVESLGDSKVAWDHIHFRGFLGHPMAMQFTWQGCDSILAAPLVIDLARFAALALERQESGPMLHLAAFFKNPLRCREHDLYRQMALLDDYARDAAAS